MRVLPKDAAVRSLTIDREGGAVALAANEFEIPGLIARLNIGIDIEKLINIAAIARKLVDRRRPEGLVKGLILSIDQRRTHRHIHGCGCLRNMQHRIQVHGSGLEQDNPTERGDAEPGCGDGYVIVPRLQSGRSEEATAVRLEWKSHPGLRIGDRHLSIGDDGAARIRHCALNCAKVCTLRNECGSTGSEEAKREHGDAGYYAPLRLSQLDAGHLFCLHQWAVFRLGTIANDSCLMLQYERET